MTEFQLERLISSTPRPGRLPGRHDAHVSRRKREIPRDPAQHEELTPSACTRLRPQDARPSRSSRTASSRKPRSRCESGGTCRARVKDEQAARSRGAHLVLEGCSPLSSSSRAQDRLARRSPTRQGVYSLKNHPLRGQGRSLSVTAAGIRTQDQVKPQLPRRSDKSAGLRAARGREINGAWSATTTPVPKAKIWRSDIKARMKANRDDQVSNERGELPFENLDAGETTS